MKKTLLFFVIIFLQNTFAYSIPNIVTSITPIAGIISMLTKDKANIVALDISGGCPHNHSAKPSDRAVIENAQMIVYIDDDFDNLITPILSDYKGIKVKISEITSLDFRGINGLNNWHFWLDLENVKILQTNLAQILIQNFPVLKLEIQQNLAQSLVKLNKLIYKKQNSLGNLKQSVILSDSLEHFFKSLNMKESKFFLITNASLSDVQELDIALKSNSLKCIILSSDQNVKLYEKYNKTIIQLNSENWELPVENDITQNLFLEEYTKIIDQLKTCL